MQRHASEADFYGLEQSDIEMYRGQLGGDIAFSLQERQLPNLPPLVSMPDLWWGVVDGYCCFF